MRQVYVSYSSQERKQATEIVQALENQGIGCWFAPRDTRIGIDWSTQVPAAIQECPYFLLILSPNSAGSEWVERELEFAKLYQKTIIPISVEDFDLSEFWMYHLGTTPIKNYTSDPIGVLQAVISRIRGSEPLMPQLQEDDLEEELDVRHVFISHSTTDEQAAEEIVAHLEAKGVKCWIAPRDTRSHTTYPAQITQAVRECPIFLILVSKLAMDSSHVDREISLAIDKKMSDGYKYIIPLMLEDCELTDEFCYYLANLHYYPYHAQDNTAVRDKITTQILQFIHQEDKAAGSYLKTAQERYAAGRYREAARLYLKAARLGNADAQTMLGYCYHTGKHGTRSIDNAVKWYTRAAAQEHANAQANLGLCYAYENGVTRDWPKAVALFQAAADKGHPGAMRHLGTCYKNGTGIAKDLNKAKFWYQKAADLGDQEAKQRLSTLK